MKKIMILFAATLLLTNLSFAYIKEGTTSDIQTLQTQGFSEGALRVVDTVKLYNQSASKKYERHYKKTKPSAYTNVKRYIDPIQDDDNFAEHEINYTNTWNGDETHYSTTKIKDSKIEDL